MKEVLFLEMRRWSGKGCGGKLLIFPKEGHQSGSGKSSNGPTLVQIASAKDNLKPIIYQDFGGPALLDKLLIFQEGSPNSGGGIQW